MTFSEILLQERKRRGLSQEELAGMVNVSRQAVSKWETGDAMPDLPKLLSLADALDISLDELCGRKVPPAADAPSAPCSKKRRWRPVVLRAVLLSLLALFCYLGRPQVPDTSSPTLLDTVPFNVSGLGFSGKSDVLVTYRFTPSISGDGLTYQIIFTDDQGNSYPIDAPCNGGVCAGEAKLEYGILGHDVTVCVSDGNLSRNLAVARDLRFSLGHASWTPINS